MIEVEETTDDNGERVPLYCNCHGAGECRDCRELARKIARERRGRY